MYVIGTDMCTSLVQIYVRHWYRYVYVIGTDMCTSLVQVCVRNWYRYVYVIGTDMCTSLTGENSVGYATKIYRILQFVEHNLFVLPEQKNEGKPENPDDFWH